MSTITAAQIIEARNPQTNKERIHLSSRGDVHFWLGKMIAYSKTMPDNILFSYNVHVSPEAAQYILDEHNKPLVVQNDKDEDEELRNRGVSEKKIRELKKIVLEGRWQVLAQGASFSRDGRLNNGQHRLMVAAELGIGLDMYFTFGEGRDAFHAIDTPNVRDGADTLTIAGHKYGVVLSAAAKMVNTLQRERVTTFSRLLNEEVLSLIKQEPKIEEFAANGVRISKELSASPTAVTVALYLIHRDTKSGQHLPRFIKLLEDGLGAGPRDRAIIKLRQGLTGKVVDAHIKHSSWRAYAQCAAIIRTWNLWRNGRNGKPGELTWNVGDQFPVAE
jgi:hypothetical protein